MAERAAAEYENWDVVTPRRAGILLQRVARAPAPREQYLLRSQRGGASHLHLREPPAYPAAAVRVAPRQARRPLHRTSYTSLGC